jgi:hypothetical protein
LGAAEHDTALRIAIVIAAAVIAFVASVVLLRPRGKPFGPFALAACCVFCPAILANLAPYIWVLFHGDAEASVPATVFMYAAAAAAGVIAARRGFGRAVLAAAVSLVIRWVLSLAFTDIYSGMMH